MDIISHTREGSLELELQGRFDANWSERVGQAIETAVRSGNHQIDLNLARVDYISSAGIRILFKHYKLLKAAKGTLRILQATPGVLSVLQLAGVDSLLVAKPTANAPAGTASRPMGQPSTRCWEQEGVQFEAFELAPKATFTAGFVGRPAAFAEGNLNPAEASHLRCTPDSIAVGLGAFGSDPGDASGRFGEFLAVAGSAITLPTDGSSVPDFQAPQGQFVPEALLLHGIAARGGFTTLLRFEAVRSQRGVLSLADLVQAALGPNPTHGLAFAILAESSSIVGATLQKSPTATPGTTPFSFPAIRDWLSFTTERSDERNVLLIVGFADQAPCPTASPHLRPVGPGSKAHGHFHAAVFPYRPLPKGLIDLGQSLSQLLATESAQDVLHLMADDRRFEGVGQTDLMRGACWYGPLGSIDTRIPS